jgi:hypothetical protein
MRRPYQSYDAYAELPPERRKIAEAVKCSDLLAPFKYG